MRTEQILTPQQKSLVDLINSQDLILSEVPLEEITGMPDYNQVLRVKDNVTALSEGYLKIIPKRILIHKTTGDELDLNLPVVNWEKRDFEKASLVDETTGQRILVETNYYDNVLNPDTDEMEEQLIETKQEPILVPVLKYLTLLIKNKKYSEIFQLFTLQYVSDIKTEDPNFFTRLK